MIKRRLASGRLHRVHRGVYSVGNPRLLGHAPLLAAVLASGEEALASHRWAAARWGVVSGASGRIDVTTTGRGRLAQSGIRLHRVRHIHPDDRSEIEGIPVTSLPRTLLDLAEVVSEQRLARALENAERLQLFDLNAMQALMARSHGRHGLKPLSMLLSDLVDPPATRSDLEDRFHDLCRDARLPRPQVNVVVAGHEVDAHWPDQRVVAELDSYAFHGHRTAFERDRVRDARLQLAGYRILRITDRMLREPEATVTTLRALLTS